MNITTYAFIAQGIFAVWFFALHFIPMPPLNDIDKFPNKLSWNRFLFLNWCILILLIAGSYLGCWYSTIFLIVDLILLMVGHINTWWLPYLFGWPKVFVEDVLIDRKVTVRFLPARGSRPVPDLGYCILGLSGLVALVLTVMGLW